MKMEIISKAGEMISVDEDVLRRLINTSQIFIDLLKGFNPEEYKGILQVFDTAANEDPDFETDRDYFVSIMCPQEIGRIDKRQAPAAGNIVRSNRDEDETYGSENHQQFEISR